MTHPTTTLALLDALQEKWHHRYMALSAKDSEKRVGQAISEAANDLGDIIEAYESERLAGEGPDEPMRTLPEAISGRIVIPHPSFSLEITSDGISPDLYAILTGSAMPTADITEEPPVGSQVTDRDGDVWERREAGWTDWFGSRWVDDHRSWGALYIYAPLRPTTDADRERVGLPVEEVCDCGSRPEEIGGAAHRIGCPEPAPTDMDPDEALAEFLYCSEHAGMEWSNAPGYLRGRYLRHARAAREHIEANQLYAYRPVAAERDKAEADLACVTKERDEQTRDAIEWRNRYGALRADVAEYVGCMGAVSAFTKIQLLSVRNRLESILAADTNRDIERAES